MAEGSTPFFALSAALQLGKFAELALFNCMQAVDEGVNGWQRSTNWPGRLVIEMGPPWWRYHAPWRDGLRRVRAAALEFAGASIVLECNIHYSLHC